MSDYALEIIPGVLEHEWDAIEQKLAQVKTFAKSVHVDLADGKMVPNTSFLDPQPFKPFADDLLLEVHMMVEDPQKYLKPFADAGFKRFIGHVEKMPSVVEFVAEGQLYGAVGLALDKQTEVNSLDVNFDDLDCLTIMTIQAGFSGQQFTEELLSKVKDIRKDSHLPIEIDGGIKDTTLPKALEAGATRFVATSFIWNSENPQEKYKELTNLLH